MLCLLQPPHDKEKAVSELRVLVQVQTDPIHLLHMQPAPDEHPLG